MITARKGSTAEKVLHVAGSQVGYHEGRSRSGWTNEQKFSLQVPGMAWSNFQAWCATFVSWVALKAGVATLFPRTASTDQAASWWQAKGRWSQYPAIAAQGFLAHNGDEYHTFLVEKYDDTFIYTIEGNTNDNGSAQGDGVYRLKRHRTDPNVEGYGLPRYPDGIVSADPKYAGLHATKGSGAVEHSGTVHPKVKLQPARARAAARIRQSKAAAKRDDVRALLERAARAVEKGRVA